MVLAGSLQLSHGLGLCKNQRYREQFKCGIERDKLHSLNTGLTSRFVMVHIGNCSLTILSGNTTDYEFYH
ncbi:hypothetical protein C1H46_000161 [Malus baccata]|uniref:Uncharacterized protein n=1 Tax=Malus baccata TaxID=106549 RepID=A0A540NT73_MALBA|nr:hypothetical protein C1H46_000161 [Malus baccata]